MTQQGERIEISNALKAYGEKHGAEYYCVIITPSKGERVTFSQPSIQDVSVVARGEVGLIIEEVVKKEVLSPPTER